VQLNDNLKMYYYIDLFVTYKFDVLA